MKPDYRYIYSNAGSILHRLTKEKNFIVAEELGLSLSTLSRLRPLLKVINNPAIKPFSNYSSIYFNAEYIVNRLKRYKQHIVAKEFNFSPSVFSTLKPLIIEISNDSNSKNI